MTEGNPVILPEVNPETKPYWEGAKRHELMIQRCKNCGVYRHPPQPMCPNCTSFETEWVKSRGRGKVFSYTIVYHPVHTAVNDKVPYNITLVELDEDVRVVSNIVECTFEDIKVGMPVEVVFDKLTDEVTLPRFKPIGISDSS